jgi:nitrite reductase/ring-hydroxylating ferredoxin subunit
MDRAGDSEAAGRSAGGSTAKAARQWEVGASEQIRERDRLVVDVAGLTVGIFRVAGRLYAYENTCAHQGGPVCQGKIIPGVTELLDEARASRGFAFDEDDLHIVCPWHGFEYSIKTGRHPGSGDVRLRSIPVEEKHGKVYVSI